MNELAIVQRQFEPLMPRLEAALGPAISHLPLPRLMQTIWVSIEQNPKLLDANRQSLFNAALTFAFLGLEVDGATGQGYLIPFKSRVQPVIGYKGYNTLAARSGLTINGDVVREGDTFDFELGSEPFVHHRPKLGEPSRKIIGAWAAASAIGRPPVVAVMGIDELLEIKGRAPGARSGDSPWNDPRVGFPAMCQKTVKRRLARGLPLNVFQQAARLEEAFEEQGIAGYIDPDRGVVTEREPIEPPTSTMLTQHPQVSREEFLDHAHSSADLKNIIEPTPTEAAHAPKEAAPDIPGEVGRHRIACSDAADRGTKELQRVWNTIPFGVRASLQATFDKQWWTRALLADRNTAEREEKLI